MRISTNLGLVSLCVLGSSIAAVTPPQDRQGLDSYDSSIHELSYGNLNRPSDPPSSGEIWFSVKDFPADKVPYIQQDVGIYTLDNLEPLKAIVQLSHKAAEQGKWGDVVFLHNVFSMNGHREYARATSPEMRQGLLAAVTKPDKSGVDMDLIDTYVRTSSSPVLMAAFNALRTTPVQQSDLAARWARESCGSNHLATKSSCRALIELIQFNATWTSGGPRNICRNGCCISWSANATFMVENLYNAANYCVRACGSAKVSCEVFGVELQGTIVNQCLSNRANGCE
ncbi:hypothetical protein E4U54_005343 [Claviceps lovelessii]|nr:hypothetical protein E4U54_005343 [Claviceps lovelessii]